MGSLPIPPGLSNPVLLSGGSSAVAATVLGDIFFYNGAIIVGSIEVQSAGAADAGRLYIGRKSTGASIVNQIELTEASSKMWGPTGAGGNIGLTITTSAIAIDYGGSNSVNCSSSGVTISGVGGFNINTAVAVTDAKDFAFGTTTGTKLGTTTTQKLGFWNKTPVVQPSATGETVGFTSGAGTAVKDDSTFTGNVGATAYRLSDIVKHLKNIGLIAS